MIYLCDKKETGSYFDDFGVNFDDIDTDDFLVYVKAGTIARFVWEKLGPELFKVWDTEYKSIAKTKIAEKMYGDKVRGEYEYEGRGYFIIDK